METIYRAEFKCALRMDKGKTVLCIIGEVEASDSLYNFFSVNNRDQSH